MRNTPSSNAGDHQGLRMLGFAFSAAAAGLGMTDCVITSHERAFGKCVPPAEERQADAEYLKRAEAPECQILRLRRDVDVGVFLAGFGGALTAASGIDWKRRRE
ncbi:MAG: hypothetical protein UT33_C0011G0049 [Candidatus Peregrinibacteria bacterium GW2011_GWC2_39_14]|nr:MAG: hypothetical protein UT33_C0011G0049 [Candidatus Peregrinibacteria bacterium GW2011_GWC2_39_14]